MVYFPWTGDNPYAELTRFFERNIADLKTAITSSGLKDQRVVIFFATTAKEATLFELQYQKGSVVETTLQTYNDHPFATVSGLTGLLGDVKRHAPAHIYSMIVGCHGYGWIPTNTPKLRSYPEQTYHWDYQGEGPKTRYFGGVTPQYKSDISSLVQGIEQADMRMEYISFDACYMANIEVAYDLRSVTDYYIASTSEIMDVGMPYTKVGEHLLGVPNYQGITTSFYDFYINYAYPYGTLAVIDCRETETLASIAREINLNYTIDSDKIASIQRLCGYNPSIFFDYADYVDKQCDDPGLVAAFKAQLHKVVPYKVNTPAIYTTINGRRTISINTFSDITTSDPSTNGETSLKTQTNWYKATH